MSKHNFKQLFNLDESRLILALLTFICVLLYPGQNNLQKIVINSGDVKNLVLNDELVELYPLNDQTGAPQLTARGVVVQDVDSSTVMYEKNADQFMIPASTTKIMTALVALDYWSDLGSIITVKNEDRAIGQTIDLVKGEQLTVRSLITGLLIHSGNDAALALADNYEGGYAGFVAAMNVKAKNLHLDSTVYKNPSGIEQYGHYTTPRDLAILAAVAMDNEFIAQTVSTQFTIITDITGNIAHPLESTNELLGVIPGLKGLKTGWTTGAGECLVSYVVQQDHPVVIVVLGSNDRFGETTKIVDWVYSHHNWITPVL